MEVLKTSEAMENQIIDEARKKAAKILQNAEKECQKWETDLKKQCGKDIQQMEAEYNHLYDKMVKDLAATLPLDMKRRKLAFIEKTIEENLADFFSNLKPAELAVVFKMWLTKVKDVFTGRAVRIRYNGLGADEVKSLINSQIPGAKILQFEQDSKMEYTGIIVKSEDEKLKYRCTVTEVKKMLTGDFRKAMYDSLFREQL